MTKKNYSSRDEIYEINSRIHLDRYYTNTRIANELNITPDVEKLQECRRNWLQHINIMPHNRLLRKLKNYRPTGRRNRWRPLKRLLAVLLEWVNKVPQFNVGKLVVVMKTTNDNTICILIFSATISETFLILRRIQQDTAINT